jgi:hypothetical protein
MITNPASGGRARAYASSERGRSGSRAGSRASVARSLCKSASPRYVDGGLAHSSLTYTYTCTDMISNARDAGAPADWRGQDGAVQLAHAVCDGGRGAASRCRACPVQRLPPAARLPHGTWAPSQSGGRDGLADSARVGEARSSCRRGTATIGWRWRRRTHSGVRPLQLDVAGRPCIQGQATPLLIPHHRHPSHGGRPPTSAGPLCPRCI